ncbi:cysteine desulfurase family protein [Tenuibacillus multivorans]|uniref:Cysteine desulfurase n=1 Tax=Tenuibacillus multivorans TaxID=237069 RepID=A0A1H0EHA8_9BACI|nr:cysteine desulfurase family protein [Tenuibacillus multivorans]GEL77162.1 aminotransferase V [Tenuibacillus multivorans]SDN81666.1 cysteine desulfurase [Tenuibacillus multivorans]
MIYLDNSATTQPDPEVLKTFQTVSTNFFANPSSIHSAGSEVEKLFNKAREQIATILKVNREEIIFTSGGTESNNLAIKGIAYEHKNRGHHIITTQIEHPAVLQVCKQLEDEGFKVTYLPVDKYGMIDMDELKQAITDETILVTIMHVNNEIGSIQPIEEIAKHLKQYPKIMFHTDHVQGYGKIPLPYHVDGLDLVSISGHKIHGLKGTGCLIKKRHVTLQPLFQGGSQEDAVRPGTENVAGIVSLAKAMRLMHENQSSYSRLNNLHQKLYQKLEKFDWTIINSSKNGAAHIFNFSIPGFKPEVLIHALGEKDIFVSTKSACSSKQNEPSHVLMACGKDLEASAAIRVSMNLDQDEHDIDQFIEALVQIVEQYENIMG